MTGQAARVAAPAGRLIDRSRTVSFTFEGRACTGLAGDTIASALAANDVWLLSRSFKYRRPRGVLTMAGLDGNTLVQVGSEPNVLADRYPISPGLHVRGQNYDGSLTRDRGRLIELFSRFLPVGFYYKAFYKPRGAWKFWEPVIRNRAGLGKVDLHAHHGYFDKEYLFADVAIVGGGPAGTAAALEAATTGAEVVLVDDMPRLGGSLAYSRSADDASQGAALADEFGGRIAASDRIRVLNDATCSGLYADNWLAIERGNRLFKLRARSVVIATGSAEQPVVFRNNDLPGVMLGSAAQRLLRLYAVKPGRRAVVLVSNADGYGVALDLADAGIEVVAIIDLRDDPPRCAAALIAASKGLRILTGYAVTEALGNHHVEAVVVGRIIAAGRCAAPCETIACDLLCMGAGYSPLGQLLHQAGARFAYDSATHMFVPADLPAHVFAAGSVNGSYSLEAVIAEGRHAGWSAARDAGFAAGVEPTVPADRGAGGQTHPWPIFPHARARDFVDFDEDVQVQDLSNAIADGYDDIELLKRYSTVGMGPSQGRHSAVATVRILARECGRDLGDLSVSTQRPPFRPVKFGVLAGRAFEPERLTAMHWRHLEAGATMMPVGLWYRPAYYGPDRAAAIRGEVLAVRNNVGIVDVSTLGGIDVRGADAAEFMNRLYTFSYTKQPVGRSRYVLMTDQSGAIVDDGVACRLHEEHFYVTATTSGVDAVFRLMLLCNAEWRLDVDVANVTAAYAGVNVAGPRSREVLRKLCGDVDLSSAGFPYLGVRTGSVCGIPARLLRVGFVGELGYELHVPASQGEALWDALLEAGAPDGIRPFGIEAQRVLRLEKGHIIIGQDTDGLTHPIEVDMAWALSRNKPYFVGGRAIQIQERAGLTRRLVGFTIDDPAAPVPQECHLTLRSGDIVGRVTSAARSPSLDRVIGLAYVAPEQAGEGTLFDIKVDAGRIVPGRVVPLPFYDPGNKRQEL